MKIYALSEFDTVEKVDAKELRRLIAHDMIAAFKRADGWIKTAEGPLRGSGGDYDGPERREVRQYPVEDVNGCHYCVLPQR
jgi:hypothetical protein